MKGCRPTKVLEGDTGLCLIHTISSDPVLPTAIMDIFSVGLVFFLCVLSRRVDNLENIMMTILRQAQESGSKGDCWKLQRGCPLSLFNMPFFHSP